MSIRNKAIAILDKHWDKTLPVNLDKIADSLGLSVEKSLGIDGDIDTSGKLSVVNGQAIATINKADTQARQRFTLAHEIGHFVLGHGSQTDKTETLYRNTQGYQPLVEQEANAFAAELIMPEIAIDFCIREQGIRTIDGLADKFGVSQIAMEYRLKNLSWL